MLEQRFFLNQHYIEYVRLLFELHKAISEGWDESEKGETLRERMDEPGSQLSSDEIASVNGIAADFYSLTDPPSSATPAMSANTWTALQSVFQPQYSSVFHKAFALLREHAGSIPPASLAYLRGKLWTEVGENRIAAAFLERASDLDPHNTNFRYRALHALWKANSGSAKEMAQAILSNWEQHPPRLVLKALDVLLQFIRAESKDHTRKEVKSFIPIFEHSIFQFETSGEVESEPDLLVKSFSHLDYCQHF